MVSTWNKKILIQSSSDEIQVTSRDPLEVLIGLVIRFRAKMFKKAFNGLLQDTWANVDFKKILNNEKKAFRYYKKIEIKIFKFVNFNLWLLFWSYLMSSPNFG